MAEVRANPGVPVAAQFAGSGAVTPCAPIVINSSTGFAYSMTATGTVVAFGTGGTVTNASALTANAIILGSGGNAVAALGSLGTTTTVLHGNAAGAPTFGAVVLTTDVSGTLGVSNGGIGQNFSGQSGVPTVNGGTWGLSATLAVSAGGLAMGSTALGEVIYGSAANTYSRLPGNTAATNRFLRSTGDGVNATAPTWGQVASGDVSGLGTAATQAYSESTWTPTFVGLTVVNGTGGATYSGVYTKIGRLVIAKWEITVTGSATTASTANSTNISNLPFTASTAGNCMIVNDSIASLGIGKVLNASTACYTPTWSAYNGAITGTCIYQA